jgi:beta-glucosidase
MKNDLHVNAYRFSIEWSKIEPQKGVYNRTAINHYHAIIDELIAKKIEPMVTIHHFTNPLWFKQLGDFEKSENIHHLVDFARFAFTEFKQVKKWCTINEPNVYATEGYIMGHFPPGKTDVKLALQVIKNMAEAHVQMYKMIKSLPGGKDAMVGVVLQLSQVHPFRVNNTLDRALAAVATAVSPGLHLDFFSTGVMSLYVPFYIDFRYENKEAVNSNDFIGLNYYTHDVIQFDFGIPPYTLVKDQNAKFSDMNWLIFPEGIYHAIRTLTKRFGKKIPIIVTENGIADRSDSNRKDFFERYLYAVSRAIKEGYNIKGYIVWSLMDNFEWAHGFFPRFGLYEVDYKTQERKLRQGAKPFVDTIRKWQKSLL